MLLLKKGKNYKIKGPEISGSDQTNDKNFLKPFSKIFFEFTDLLAILKSLKRQIHSSLSQQNSKIFKVNLAKGRFNKNVGNFFLINICSNIFCILTLLPKIYLNYYFIFK